ncbi:MAG: polymer-forming cytoskeletal protein [Syntrophales bacterium]|nr:polymer-forming cytoskeletal protein [Syntrophales bacterium]
MMFGIKRDRIKLVLGEGAKIWGNVEAPGTILVEGNVVGNVQAEKVIAGEKASIKGDITAAFVTVAGTVEGNIHAGESVVLKATARMTGDMDTQYLTVHEGAIFNGISRMSRLTAVREEEKIITFTAKEKDRTV